MAQMAGLGLPAGTSRPFDVKLDSQGKTSNMQKTLQDSVEILDRKVLTHEDETDLKWDECEVTGLT